jgi:hypothetical protein
MVVSGHWKKKKLVQRLWSLFESVLDEIACDDDVCGKMLRISSNYSDVDRYYSGKLVVQEKEQRNKKRYYCLRKKKTDYYCCPE